MTGFIAGMPFLGDLDDNIRAKRLETPRVKVPKGSIGLTDPSDSTETFERDTVVIEPHKPVEPNRPTGTNRSILSNAAMDHLSSLGLLVNDLTLSR